MVGNIQDILPFLRDIVFPPNQGKVKRKPEEEKRNKSRCYQYDIREPDPETLQYLFNNHLSFYFLFIKYSITKELFQQRLNFLLLFLAGLRYIGALLNYRSILNSQFKT